MELHAFMGLQVLVSPFLSSRSQAETDSLLRVLDNCGVPYSKDGSRLSVDVDLSLLKRAGLCARFPRARGFH